MSFGTEFLFQGGNQEWFLAGIFGFIGLMALLYSLVSIRRDGGMIAEYYIFLLLLVGSGFGVVFARDLLWLFVFWELATVALWRLVSYFRYREALEAGLWALYLNFVAAATMLVGLVILQLEYGTWSLEAIAGREIQLLPAILILVGIVAKSAALPLYIWLPRAYRYAPAPICALLSGLGENLGLVLFYKLFVVSGRVPPLFFLITAIVAVASSLVAGGVALITRTIRETLAYSTVSQLGFILLGLTAGGYYGITGGLLYIMAHAVAKAGLFFTAGIVEEAEKTGELEQLGGWAKISPALAGASGVLVLSIMGLPPTVGFFAKMGVVIGAVQENLLYGIGSLVAALFTVLYLSRLYARIFLGQRKVEVNCNISVSKIAVGLVVVMAVITVLAGVLWFIPVLFISGGV